MSSFTLAFNVVFPLFLMMALGYVLTRIKLFTSDFLKQLNNVCFKIFLPCILFINIYESNVTDAFQLNLLLFAIMSVIGMFLILLILVTNIEKRNDRKGVLIQGMFRSNYILFGMPIATSLFGIGNVGTTAILIAFVVPLFNILSVIVLELFNGQKIEIRQMVLRIVKNPLILASCFAFILILRNVVLPNVIVGTIKDISNIATPLALLVLGGSFSFHGLHKNRNIIIYSVFIKLCIVPTIFVSISILLGFRGMALGALLALFCSPTAVSSFTMAQQCHADDELAGQIVVVSSLFSIISIFLWIMACESYLLM